MRGGTASQPPRSFAGAESQTSTPNAPVNEERVRSMRDATASQPPAALPCKTADAG